MTRKYYSGIGLCLLALGFIAFTLLNNLLFGGTRLDLTENRLYTLSDGSREIVQTIDEPINLYFFFSEKSSADLTSIRVYATRVREMLEEYELAADGKINLTVVDPEPFSEAEDQAAEFGLQGVPVTSAGEELYFGLAATNSLDDQATIPFFQPDKEEFLEYEVSKLIQGLVVAKKPTVGILSSLEVQGNMDMQTFQMSPSWMVIDQLEQLFSTQRIDPVAEALPDDIDILLLIHPKQLSESMLYSIDQFVMGGGKMLAFTDPMAEMDRPAQTNPMMPAPPAQPSSSLNRLTEPWGVTMRSNTVLGDSQTALQVSSGDGTPSRHLAILGMQPDNFSSDIVTASLESINVATAGILDIAETPAATVEPLISSSTWAMPMDALQFQFLSDPAQLMQGFEPTGERYMVAARLSGSAPSAFPEGLETTEDDETTLTETDNLNVILVADTDILTDRLWVQVQNFFGQRIASPWANNGDLFTNALDNLAGSASLIGIRSRGAFTRPFDKVQDLRREAEERYLQNANDLQSRLAETEQKLHDLESNQVENNLLVLNPEQENALVEFQEEKLKIRKQLREVRHQLDRDIEVLGSRLKFVNIALIPILMTLLLLVLNYIRLHRRREASS